MKRRQYIVDMRRMRFAKNTAITVSQRAVGRRRTRLTSMLGGHRHGHLGQRSWAGCRAVERQGSHSSGWDGHAAVQAVEPGS